MTNSFRALVAAGFLSALATAPAAVSPAQAAVDRSDPGRFIKSLTDDGFAVLRTGKPKAARAQFRALLSDNFAVDGIGDRLIRRWSPRITPAQRSAYKAAFPNFIIGTYADRLFAYSRASVRVVRVIPGGAGAQVLTTVSRPGSDTINATWTVEGTPGNYKVSNLVVAGINLAVAQSADFDAVIQQRGFDALVAMMKSRS